MPRLAGLEQYLLHPLRGQQLLLVPSGAGRSLDRTVLKLPQHDQLVGRECQSRCSHRLPVLPPDSRRTLARPMLQLPRHEQLGRLHLQPRRLRQLQSLPLGRAPGQPRERPVFQVPRNVKLGRSEHANTYTRATHTYTDTHPAHANSYSDTRTRTHRGGRSHTRHRLDRTVSTRSRAFWSTTTKRHTNLTPQDAPAGRGGVSKTGGRRLPVTFSPSFRLTREDSKPWRRVTAYC